MITIYCFSYLGVLRVLKHHFNMIPLFSTEAVEAHSRKEVGLMPKKLEPWFLFLDYPKISPSWNTSFNCYFLKAHLFYVSFPSFPLVPLNYPLVFIALLWKVILPLLDLEVISTSTKL